MKRAAAVRHILDHILRTTSPKRFEYVNSGYAQIVEGFGWHARIHTPFNPSYRRCRSGLPNGLGLWLFDGPKVLKVSWNEAEVRVINMRRGDWEAEFFGLPPFEGRSKLQPWELRRKRSRRW